MSDRVKFLVDYLQELVDEQLSRPTVQITHSDLSVLSELLYLLKREGD